MLKIVSNSLFAALLGGHFQRRGANERGDYLSEQGFGVNDSGC